MKHLISILMVFVVSCLFLGGCNGENLKFTLVKAEAGRINPALPPVQTKNAEDGKGSKESSTTFGAVEKDCYDPSSTREARR